MPKLVIFDLDGTLAHTAPDLLGTLNRVTASHDISPMGLEHIGQIIGHGAKAMIAKAFEIGAQPLSEELHDQLFEAFLHDYADNLANETYLFEHLIDSLDTLEDRGYHFSVCTNKKHAMAVPLLEQLGIHNRFKAITGGDSFEFRKPDPRHLIETAKLSGFDIERCIMVGDSQTDINAAINARIPSVAVTFGYSDLPVDQLGANHVIDHYSALPKAIASIG